MTLIDLVSDTATRPTPDMRRAMAEAPVGDEQRGEDPSVNALNARVAELLGKKADFAVVTIRISHGKCLVPSTKCLVRSAKCRCLALGTWH